jgi:hypothetical protein
MRVNHPWLRIAIIGMSLQCMAFAVPVKALAQGAGGGSYISPTHNYLIEESKTESTTSCQKKRWEKQNHTSEQRNQEVIKTDANAKDAPSQDNQGKGSEKEDSENKQEQKTEEKDKPYWLVDLGYCEPSGRYRWITKAGPREGVCPNPVYAQKPPVPGGLGPGKFKDSYWPAMTDQLMNLIPDEAKGTPISNAEFATLCAAQAEQISELMTEPERNICKAQAEGAAKQADAANNAAECAEGNSEASWNTMTNYLINVANEGAAEPTASRSPFKKYSQAVWMVQQMYKKCYIPMAILFLLPGAVITQCKSLVGFGIMGSRDEDASSPFSGLFRATIAIFLIPATQLAVSYIIDTGNAVTECVVQELNKNGGLEVIKEWAKQQTYNNKEEKYKNFVENKVPQPNQPEIGKISGDKEEQMLWERQTMPSTMMQQWYNTFNQVVGQGLAIINAFQLIMICYLFLLGPMAAAFFAWPSGVGRDLFRKVFASWLDGIVILALWKFWWNIVLLCMAIRLSSGIVTNPTDQYEMYMFTAFMAMLLFVPFNPFEFRPGEVVSHVLEKAQQQAGKAGQSSGSGAGAGPSGGSGNQANGGTPAGAKHKSE